MAGQQIREIKNVGQSIAQSTKNFADVTKLNKEISDYEKQIKGLYILVGKAYYERHKDDSDAEDRENISKIKVLFKQIDDLKRKVDNIEGISKCPNCGKDIPSDALFCNNCGCKIPKEPEGTLCSNCGKLLAEDSMFCAHCGTKVKQLETEAASAEMEDNVQKNCPVCHTTLAEEDCFCPECGHPANQNPEMEDNSR